MAEQGKAEEGVAHLRQGMAASEAIGIGVDTLMLAHSPLLVEAYGKAGQAAEGLSLLAEALDIITHRTGARRHEAELYRLKGQLTLQKFQVSGSKFQVTSPQPLVPNPQVEAEACFHKATEIARQQQAKSLELRAVMSLARLWQSRGKKEEARRMLAEIYGWFTEGFDTADLREAKSLLEQLS
jgi:hypothetical protein